MKKIIVVVIASSLLFACKQEKQKSLATLKAERAALDEQIKAIDCLLYTSPSPRDAHESRMPSSA